MKASVVRYLMAALLLPPFSIVSADDKLVPTASFTVSSPICQNGAVQFTNTSFTSVGRIIYFRWEFGDGKESTEENPTHVYTSSGDFDVRLTVLDTEGEVAETTVSLTVEPAPVVDFTIDLADSCLATNQTFNGSASVTSGSISSFRWDYGDQGFCTTAQNCNHTFSASGTYEVTFTATSASGCSSSVIKEITVFEEPNPDFEFEEVCDGAAVEFTNTSTIINGNLTYSWDFGDTEGSTFANPLHIYDSPGDYTVVLTATSADGQCDLARTKTVTIHPDPVSSFEAPSVCFGTDAGFTNNSTGVNLSFNWDFGDGNTSTERVPVGQRYDLPGSYLVNLEVTSDDGCTDVSEKRIDVFENPTPVFFAADNCLRNTVEFSNLTNTEGDTYTYAWDFGDGEGADLKNPTHNYNGPGTYTVTLSATTSNNCEATYEEAVVIWNHPDTDFIVPDVDFAVSDGCVGVEVALPNTSTILGGETIESYLWDFGDGSGSTQVTATHTYGAPGTYDVTLKAISANGCEDEITKPITITAKPITDFSFEGTCNGNVVSFVNESSVTDGNLNYTWDFGDGSTMSNGVNSIHEYANQGRYNVTLTATNNVGACFTSITKPVDIFQELTSEFNFVPVCFGEEVVFDNTSIGTGVSFLWNFGDGNTSTFYEPGHLYESPGSYIVKLQVESNDGCVRQAEKRVDIFENPVPVFFFDNSCALEEVLFTNLTDESVGELTYWWDFGDGNSSSTREPIHRFETMGTYTVSLTATTPDDCQMTVSNTIEIYEIPVPDFTVANVCDGFPSEFVDESTGSIQSYFWDFGDLTNSTLENPVKQYLTPGTYEVVLSVESFNGCINAIKKTAIVNEVPVAGFEATDVCFEDETSFTDQSIDPSATTLYNWEFGDGASSIAQNPAHTYSSPGIYPVNLTITSFEGCVDSSSKLVIVFDLPEVDAGQDTTISRGASAQLQARGGVDYQWSPITGLNHSTIANPLARPLENTIYTVTVTDQNGCQNTDQVLVSLREDFRVVANNVFTPDGNGMNDQWIIPNADAFEQVQVKIYDRYGVLVFEDDDYQNDWEGTRGTDILPDGTYYYTIMFTGTDKYYSGALTILRNR